MARILPKKDVVIIGLGWTGSVMANELTDEGLDVIAIERGPWRDGKIPVNVSGGLVSKGHPLGCTGVANLVEVAFHLRGEAGDRQIEGATVGLTHVIGLGSACAIHILEKASV